MLLLDSGMPRLGGLGLRGQRHLHVDLLLPAPYRSMRSACGARTSSSVDRYQADDDDGEIRADVRDPWSEQTACALPQGAGHESEDRRQGDADPPSWKAVVEEWSRPAAAESAGGPGSSARSEPAWPRWLVLAAAIAAVAWLLG